MNHQPIKEDPEISEKEKPEVFQKILPVKGELQSWIGLPEGIQNMMENLLSITGVGIIFVDVHLTIRWFTPFAANLYTLTDADLGRPFGEIRSIITQDNLIDDVKIVLESCIAREREIQTDNKYWFLFRVWPFLDSGNVLVGVVISFTDITSRKVAEEELIKSREYAMSIVDTVREPLLILDRDLKVISASHSFYQNFQTTPAETEGKNLTEIGDHQWNIPHLITLIQTVLPKQRSFHNLKISHSFPGLGERILILNARIIYGKSGVSDLILLAMEDVSELIQTKEAFQEANKKLKLLSSLTRHDIINQIFSISLTLEILEGESDLDVIRGRLSSVSEICRKMGATIGFTKEYEDFGTISSGWHLVSPIINSSIEEISLLGVTISNEVPDTIEVYAEPILRKVFSTLIENAVRHGENISSIHFFGLEEGDAYIITCEDDGKGISAGKKEMIFNHGYGTHTGIGLFIAREILSITGLSIRECGVEGEGARFEITIPSGKFRRAEG